MYEDFFNSFAYIQASTPDIFHHEDVFRKQENCPVLGGKFIAETKLEGEFYILICSKCGGHLREYEDGILEHMEILPGSIMVMPRTVNPKDEGSNPSPAAFIGD